MKNIPGNVHIIRGMLCNGLIQGSLPIISGSHCIGAGENTSLSPLQWCHNGHNSDSNHHPHDCLLNRLFSAEKSSKLRVTGLCMGNSPLTGKFPAQMASNAETVFVWWRHQASASEDTYMQLSIIVQQKHKPYNLWKWRNRIKTSAVLWRFYL